MRTDTCGTFAVIANLRAVRFVPPADAYFKCEREPGADNELSI